jgi:hypothetical protein
LKFTGRRRIDHAFAQAGLQARCRPGGDRPDVIKTYVGIGLRASWPKWFDVSSTAADCHAGRRLVRGQSHQAGRVPTVICAAALSFISCSRPSSIARLERPSAPAMRAGSIGPDDAVRMTPDVRSV